MELTFYKDAGGKYRWRLVATRNGKIVGASSQGFVNKSIAKENVRIVLQGLQIVLDVAVIK